MNLTTKQREALQALADVMKEHDIEIHYCEDYDWNGFNILAGNFANKQTSEACIAVILNQESFSHHSLTKLLQEQE